MADIKALETALINADKAGDASAARALVAELVRARSAAPAKPLKIGAEGLPDAVREVSANFSVPEKFAVGFKSALDDMALRLKQLTTGGLAPDDVNTIQANRALRDESGAALTGNIAGNLAATAVPGAGLQAGATALAAKAVPAAIAPTLGAAATGGAIAAGTSPVLEGESTLKNAALGAAGAAVGDTAGRVLSRVAQPIKQSKDVQKLLGEGVVPTPGQAAGAGSFVGRVEQKLMSLPIVGDIIKKGRDRAVEEFDIAAIRRSLPTDSKGQITSAGRAAIEKADEILGSSYDDVYKGITVKPDTQFLRGVVGVKNDPDLALPKELQSRLGEVVKTQVLDRVKKGELSGPLAQRIDSNLGSIARRYASSQDADQRVLGIAIREVQKNFKELVERNAGGETAGTIRELNRSYANFLRVERAASLKGAQDGVFSAEQLSGAVRALDRSSNKGSYAKGSALMQDLSDAGRSVLGNTVPNSGTADRLGTALMLGAPAAGAANEYFGGPSYLTALAAAPLLYSRGGGRYMVGDLPAQAGIAATLRNLSPYFAQAGRAVSQ
jgi:hypothetical protein